jgi:hypothetical protein
LKKQNSEYTNFFTEEQLEIIQNIDVVSSSVINTSDINSLFKGENKNFILYYINTKEFKDVIDNESGVFVHNGTKSLLEKIVEKDFINSKTTEADYLIPNIKTIGITESETLKIFKREFVVYDTSGQKVERR